VRAGKIQSSIEPPNFSVLSNKPVLMKNGLLINEKHFSTEALNLNW
jgi:hypothetical protein